MAQGQSRASKFIHKNLPFQRSVATDRFCLLKKGEAADPSNTYTLRGNHFLFRQVYVKMLWQNNVKFEGMTWHLIIWDKIPFYYYHCSCYWWCYCYYNNAEPQRHQSHGCIHTKKNSNNVRVWGNTRSSQIIKGQLNSLLWQTSRLCCEKMLKC